MAQSTNVLAVQARNEKGKGPARRLRAKGLIPAVVYGQKLEPTHIAVDPAAIQKAIATPHKLNTLLTLQLDGSEKRVLFREYEVDPVSRKLLHADFLEVNLAKPVKVEVDVTPLKIGGSIHIADVKAPEGVKIKYATNFTVAVVTAPEKEEVVAPVAAVGVPGAAPAEGAAAPAAGAAAAAGAAPAAGGAKAAAPAAAAKADAKGGGA